MQIKRVITTGGLVGAVALGAMVLAGPAAEASTATPSVDLCTAAMNKGLSDLTANHLLTPTRPVSPNSLKFVLYSDANMEGGRLGDLLWYDAQGIEDDC